MTYFPYNIHDIHVVYSSQSAVAATVATTIAATVARTFKAVVMSLLQKYGQYSPCRCTDYAAYGATAKLL